MENFKRVYIIDQTSEGDHHMIFNTSLIKMMALINPNSQLIYYGTPSDIISVKHLLNDDEIETIDFREISYRFYPQSIILKLFNYGLKEMKRMYNFFSILNKSSKVDLIVLSITTFTSFLGFKILKAFYKTPTLVVLHGDVDYVYHSPNLISKINGWVHRLIFKIKAPNFRYLTLNKIEKGILVRDGHLKENDVYEIEHPFLSIKNDFEERLPEIPLKLGHIGSMEVERKNSHYIFELAKMSQSLIEKNKVIFKSVGLMTPEVVPYKNRLVELIVGNEEENSPKYLTRNEYELELENLDYILFFYPPHEYIFRASGAVVDFLAKNKPIICLRHPLFEYMFKKAGDIGYICETLEEIYVLLEKITSPSYKLNEIYIKQARNIQNYKKEFTIDQVAKDLENQLNKVQFE